MQELRKKVYALIHEGKISHEQGYRLMQLAEEGIDIEIGLAGRVNGITRNIRLAEAVRASDEKAVSALIRESSDEEADEIRRVNEHARL